MVTLNPGEVLEELFGDKKIIQNKELYRFTSDSILLSRFARAKAGDKVAVAGFGNFEVKERAAREGRNPATGEAITIAASKTVAFKASKALKESV